jgi:hypothetical protein
VEKGKEKVKRGMQRERVKKKKISKDEDEKRRIELK